MGSAWPAPASGLAQTEALGAEDPDTCVVYSQFESVFLGAIPRLDQTLRGADAVLISTAGVCRLAKKMCVFSG